MKNTQSNDVMTKDEMQKLLMQCWHREISVEEAMASFIWVEPLVEETLGTNVEVNDECLEALQPVDKKTDDFYYTGIPDIDMRRVIQMEANRIYSDRS